MNDVAIVRVLNRIEDGKAQMNALDGRQAVVVGVAIDASATDVLHHEIWQSIGRRAAIEERRDVGMRERGENLTFVPESADDQFGIHPAADHLDGDAALEDLVDAASQIDRTHTAAPDAGFDEVRTQRTSDIRLGCVSVDRGDERCIEQEGRTGVGVQE